MLVQPPDPEAKTSTAHEPSRNHTLSLNIVAALAISAVWMHLLDLATALEMMERDGIHAETNPLARALFVHAGPSGLAVVKLGVVLCGVLLLMRLARTSRPYLAATALLFVVALGLIGFLSNGIY